LPRSSFDGPVIEATDGVRVAIRLLPRAKSDRLIGLAVTAGGGCTVKASVTAPAQDGRANEALLRLLARSWKLPRRDLSIVAGLASRNKTVRVAGDPHRLSAKLTGEIAGLPAPNATIG
jgi:uncharacterized protein (TIGR00251 family)